MPISGAQNYVEIIIKIKRSKISYHQLLICKLNIFDKHNYHFSRQNCGEIPKLPSKTKTYKIKTRHVRPQIHLYKLPLPRDRYSRNLTPKLMQIQNNIKILPLIGAFFGTIVLKYNHQVCHNTNLKVFRLTLIALPLVESSVNQVMLIYIPLIFPFLSCLDS